MAESKGWSFEIGLFGLIVICTMVGGAVQCNQDYYKHREKMAEIESKAVVKKELSPPAVELGESTDGGKVE